MPASRPRVSRATSAGRVADPHAGRYAPRSGSKHCNPCKGTGCLVSSLTVDSRCLGGGLLVCCGVALLPGTTNSGNQFPVLRFADQSFWNSAAVSVAKRKLPRRVLP